MKYNVSHNECHSLITEPSIAPTELQITAVNATTFTVSWSALSREQSNGEVVMYEVKCESYHKLFSVHQQQLNTTATFVLLEGLRLCLNYHIHVRAYTTIGPGPYSNPVTKFAAGMSTKLTVEF